jgi:hypothetical protein
MDTALIKAKRGHMCKRLLLSVISGALWLFTFSAIATELNVKWTEDSQGAWSLSISPQGPFYLDEHVKNVRCTALAETCYGGWKISVGDKRIECLPVITAPVGTSAAAFAPVMQSAYNGKTCTLSNLNLNGTEKICIENVVRGQWMDSSTTFGFGYSFYSTLSCQDGGAGGGGIVEPPIKPLSCSIQSEIPLAHGTVEYSKLSASKAAYTATVSCTRQATVKIALANGGKVNLKNDGSFYSVISVMDQPGGAQFFVNGSLPVRFSSQLYTVGSDPINGVFGKSAVAVMNIL